MTQRNELQKHLTFSVIFTGGYSVTNDHPTLVAIRNLSLDIIECEFHISDASERVLIIGAAANNFIHYYVYGKDNKDVDRIVRPALMTIAKNLRHEASKKDKRIFLPPKDDQDRTQPRGVLKRYRTIEAMSRDYCDTNKMPDNIHTDYVPANTLVCEDSIII